MAPDPTPVDEPFPISRVAGRYLLFDVNVISHARRNHNICGVLIGTIPNLSQQNIFLGLPLELSPEETRVLVEQGHAYIVEDADVHRKGFMEMSREDRLQFMKEMDRQGLEISKEVVKRAEARSAQVLKEKGLRGKGQKSDKATASTSAPASAETSTADNESLLFESDSTKAVSLPEKKLEPTFITPTTSYPPLSLPLVEPAVSLPEVSKTFPLFRYLHSRGYFMMPGIRFGCNYSVYPGDPLRFHSHFLASGMDWDEEFDLLDVVGGGRLGTGVKKAYLIGGEDKDAPGQEEENGVSTKPVRAFSVEWAGL